MNSTFRSLRAVGVPTYLFGYIFLLAYTRGTEEEWNALQITEDDLQERRPEVA